MCCPLISVLPVILDRKVKMVYLAIIHQYQLTLLVNAFLARLVQRDHQVNLANLEKRYIFL